MEVRVLGSLEVVDDLGRLVAVRGARLTCLLIALALRCGEVGERRPPERHPVGRRRRPTAPTPCDGRSQPCVRSLGRADTVIRRGNGYVLAVEKDAVDTFRFESLGGRGRDALRDGEFPEAAAGPPRGPRAVARRRPCRRRRRAIRRGRPGPADRAEKHDDRGSHRRRSRAGPTRRSRGRAGTARARPTRYGSTCEPS